MKKTGKLLYQERKCVYLRDNLSSQLMGRQNPLKSLEIVRSVEPSIYKYHNYGYFI